MASPCHGHFEFLARDVYALYGTDPYIYRAPVRTDRLEEFYDGVNKARPSLRLRLQAGFRLVEPTARREGMAYASESATRLNRMK
jgi:hypothetical protein